MIWDDMVVAYVVSSRLWYDCKPTDHCRLARHNTTNRNTFFIIIWSRDLLSRESSAVCCRQHWQRSSKVAVICLILVYISSAALMSAPLHSLVNPLTSTPKQLAIRQTIRQWKACNRFGAHSELKSNEITTNQTKAKQHSKQYLHLKPIKRSKVI